MNKIKTEWRGHPEYLAYPVCPKCGGLMKVVTGRSIGDTMYACLRHSCPHRGDWFRIESGPTVTVERITDEKVDERRKVFVCWEGAHSHGMDVFAELGEAEDFLAKKAKQLSFLGSLYLTYRVIVGMEADVSRHAGATKFKIEFD